MIMKKINNNKLYNSFLVYYDVTQFHPVNLNICPRFLNHPVFPKF